MLSTTQPLHHLSYLPSLFQLVILYSMLLSTLQIRPIDIAQQFNKQEGRIRANEPPLPCVLASLLVMNEMQAHSDCVSITKKEQIAADAFDMLLCPTNADYNACENAIGESYKEFLQTCDKYSVSPTQVAFDGGNINNNNIKNNNNDNLDNNIHNNKLENSGQRLGPICRGLFQHEEM